MVTAHPILLATATLLIAAVLDFWLGDPWHWPHPVQVMGWMISNYCKLIQRYLKAAWLQRIAGMSLTLGLVLGSATLSWLIVRACYQLQPLLAVTVSTIWVASGLAGRSLRTAALDVIQPLQVNDVALARQRLSLYVGRDTATLAQPEILRAVLETVSENATDGVLAPLFYAILGACIPGLGSAPLVLAYKAASTLDSMVGYRTPPYRHLGWASAKFEDLVTWLPCRLVVLSIALLSGRSRHVLQLCWRDARADPSPNAGWSECAYAAALGVQLGGVNWYQGLRKEKPLLGDAQQPITVHSIQQALTLTRQCFLLWLSLGTIALAFSWIYAA